MASASQSALSTSPALFGILLDAGSAFPYPPREAKLPTSTWASTAPVSTALALLTEDEQSRVKRFHFPKDAALSLSSFLLKHTAILRAHPTLPWSSSTISQERSTNGGKPYYAGGGVEFNVSHHGEAAVLIGTTLSNINVGIDLVRVDPVKDVKTVQESGWDNWCSTYESVFSQREVDTMRHSIGTQSRGLLTAQDILRGLRCFYAFWALKEAYTKMTGEALLANWLQVLEFSEVHPPAPTTGSQIDDKWAWGERTTAQASLRDVQIEGVRLELRALGEHYMVAIAVNSNMELPVFDKVQLEDIASLARQ